MKYLKWVVFVCLTVVLGIFVSSPSKYMQSFLDGLSVWAINVLPALFPFAVISVLMLKTAPQSKFSVTEKLFGTSCDGIWTTSLLCGYPMGAKAIADSAADQNTATQLCAFCSTAGPIFMIATVGAKLLHNGVAAAIIVFSQIAASVINGILFRPKNKLPALSAAKEHHGDFGSIITDSVLSVLSVGGLIALFYMLSDMAKTFLPNALTNNVIVAYSFGLLEMTNGILAVCKIADIATATVLCSNLLALGGVCVFLQCYAFLGKKHISIAALVKMKLVQALAATAISLVLSMLFL